MIWIIFCVLFTISMICVISGVDEKRIKDLSFTLNVKTVSEIYEVFDGQNIEDIMLYSQKAAIFGRKDILEILFKEEFIMASPTSLIKCAVVGKHYDLAIWINEQQNTYQKMRGGDVLDFLCLNNGVSEEISDFLLKGDYLHLLDRWGIENYSLLDRGCPESAKWLWEHRECYNGRKDLFYWACQFKNIEILRWLHERNEIYLRKGDLEIVLGIKNPELQEYLKTLPLETYIVN